MVIDKLLKYLARHAAAEDKKFLTYRSFVDHDIGCLCFILDCHCQI